MVLSALTGCLASWLGLYASYYFGIAAGGAIIVVASLLFALALIAAPIRRGLRLLSRPRLPANAAIVRS
jgi:manganese/iron transport system permease protein